MQCLKVNNFMKTYVYDPFIYGLEVLLKPRKTLIKVMLCIQVVNCTLYWFTMEEQNMLYFYMSRKFAGFDGNDFAIYTITIKVSVLLRSIKRVYSLTTFFFSSRLQAYLVSFSPFHSYKSAFNCMNRLC